MVYCAPLTHQDQGSDKTLQEPAAGWHKTINQPLMYTHTQASSRYADMHKGLLEECGLFISIHRL